MLNRSVCWRSWPASELHTWRLSEIYNLYIEIFMFFWTLLIFFRKQYRIAIAFSAFVMTVSYDFRVFILNQGSLENQLIWLDFFSSFDRISSFNKNQRNIGNKKSKSWNEHMSLFAKTASHCLMTQHKFSRVCTWFTSVKYHTIAINILIRVVHEFWYRQ